MIAGLLFNRLEKQVKPEVAFDPKRCLRTRLSGNACERCVALCPKKALTLSGGRIVFEEDKCTECMACVSGCPNDAFVHEFDLLSILPALAGGENAEPMVFACRKSSHVGNRITVPCIGLLSEPVLAVMHCLARHELYLDLHRCADCENGELVELFHKRMEGLLAANGTSAALRIRVLIDRNHSGAASGNERRFFLGKATNTLMELGREVSSAFVPSAASETGRETSGKNVSLTNRLLQETLRRLPPPAVQEKKLLFAYHHTLTANGNCDRCPACTGMCPAGALKRTKAQEINQLHFTSAHCSGCGLCVKFCKKGALALLPGVRTDPEVAVAIA